MTCLRDVPPGGLTARALIYWSAWAGKRILALHEEGTLKPLPHHYDVHLTGGASGYAQLSAPGIPELRSGSPVEFDGPGDAWSPEHLLLASVQACLLFTLRTVARLSKLEFISLEVDGTGTVDREGSLRFTEIVLRPRLTVPPGTDHDRARRVLEKSEKACLVSASLSTPIRLEPEIRDG